MALSELRKIINLTQRNAISAATTEVNNKGKHETVFDVINKIYHGMQKSICNCISP